MFSSHIPGAMYERLPKLYLLAACLLIFVEVELPPAKWTSVVALALAALLTHARRRSYREAQRRAALLYRVAHRYGKT